jgi:RNA recognition motif-containing protein
LDNKKKVYVGNLSYSVTTDELRKIFTEFGEVVDATVITDKMSGRSKGFGFVEYGEEEMAQKAVDEMNGKEVDGRKLVVNFARPPREQ